MTRDELQAEAKRLIDALASAPRFAGSAPEAWARRLCESELGVAGFASTEQPFEFSEWPGRFGIPLISSWLLLSILLIPAAAIVAAPSTAMVAGVIALVAGSVFASRRRNTATAAMKSLRSSSSNLEARRGTPRVWLVAHLDSKSQSVPMLLRVASHVALLAILYVALGIGLVATVRGAGYPYGRWVAAAAAVAALPGMFCLVGNNSPGALDNASGVAAVLLAARLVPRQAGVGILITSGEELDLAGARAWARQPRPGAIMLNCDTIDKEGDWRCMYAKGPNAAGAAAARAAKKLGLPLRMGKVIPGIITDSLAFETAGIPSVTVSRGTLRTLARLHTAGDNADSLSGAGAATAARLLAGMVEELS